MLCVIATSFTGCFGRKKSGEAFSMPIMDEPTSLDPQIADSNSEKLVAANCYEGRCHGLEYFRRRPYIYV